MDIAPVTVTEIIQKFSDGYKAVIKLSDDSGLKHFYPVDYLDRMRGVLSNQQKTVMDEAMLFKGVSIFPISNKRNGGATRVLISSEDVLSEEIAYYVRESYPAEVLLQLSLNFNADEWSPMDILEGVRSTVLSAEFEEFMKEKTEDYPFSVGVLFPSEIKNIVRVNSRGNFEQNPYFMIGLLYESITLRRIKATNQIKITDVVIGERLND